MKPTSIDLARLLNHTRAAASQTGPNLEAARAIEAEIATKQDIHRKAEALDAALRSAQESYEHFANNLDDLFSKGNQDADLGKLKAAIAGSRSASWDLAAVMAGYEVMKLLKPEILKRFHDETVGPVEELIRSFAKENNLQL